MITRDGGDGTGECHETMKLHVVSSLTSLERRYKDAYPTVINRESEPR